MKTTTVGSLIALFLGMLVWADLTLGVGDSLEVSPYQYPEPTITVPAWSVPVAITVVLVLLSALRYKAAEDDGLGPMRLLGHLFPIGVTWVGYFLFLYWLTYR